MTVTVKTIRTCMQSELNVLLVGLHGVGKTGIIKAACEAEGLSFKSFNAATMDPFTDFVGVPSPTTTADGKKTLEMVRPREIDDAEVVFLDELNRADSKTLNAVFELVQFRSINGEKLPKLKVVLAAMNPHGGDYAVGELDPAFLDRFDVCFDMPAKADLAYFMSKFEPEVAQTLVDWYNARDTARTDYPSPRRLEILGNVWTKTRSKKMLAAAFPPEGNFDSGKLYAMLSGDTSGMHASLGNLTNTHEPTATGQPQNSGPVHINPVVDPNPGYQPSFGPASNAGSPSINDLMAMLRSDYFDSHDPRQQDLLIRFGARQAMDNAHIFSHVDRCRLVYLMHNMRSSPEMMQRPDYDPYAMEEFFRQMRVGFSGSL